MGKKSKASRNKVTVAGAAAAAATAATATATATATVATTAACTAETVETRNTARRGQFPRSTFAIKAESFFLKGNHAKAKKICLQGVKSGCVPCMNAYGAQILFEGNPEENPIDEKRVKDNPRLHLVMPLFLEGAIRGSAEAINTIVVAYLSHGYRDITAWDGFSSYEPIAYYWLQYTGKNADREHRVQIRKGKEMTREEKGRWCSVCHKQDSDTVTLRKCDGCKFYYYCSTECQKLQWHAGHASVCRHLGLLKKYHKPFAKKIWTDLVVHGIAPTDIPELVELRHRLGLSRPHADYQELLDEAQSLRPQADYLLPRKDGTVQIGSFPRPI